MTNKEAIEIIKGIYPNGVYSPTEELRHEAINMAISALANTQECHMVETLRMEYEKGRADVIAKMHNPAWSLDDEKYLVDAIVAFCHYYGDSYTEKLGGWLKSLKERYTWKPSEEQMKSLARAGNRCVSLGDAKNLVKLQEELEKL